jgi:hypothetical protein
MPPATVGSGAVSSITIRVTRAWAHTHASASTNDTPVAR